MKITLATYALILGLSALLACSESESKSGSQPVEKSEFEVVLADYYQDRLKHYPLEATYAGDTRYNDTLPNDISEGYRQKLRDFYQTYLNKLEGYTRDSLEADEQLSYDILKWECEGRLEELSYPTHLTPLDQFWSLHISMGQLASGSSAQPFKTAEDYDNWLKRLDDYLVWLDTARANMRRGIAQNYTLPRALTLKLIPQMDALDDGPVAEHLFFSPIKQLPEEISEEDSSRLAEAYTKMVGERVIPAYKEMHNFLQKEYLPASRSSTGALALPDAKKYYDFRIRQFTTLELSADSVFALGKAEVQRLRSEMEKVKKQVGFKGDLKAFFEYVRNKKELMPFDTAAQVITHFNRIHEKMKPQLSRLFDLTPKTPFEVRRTEAFREASASAEYIPGSLDGTRPGIFYVPVPNAAKYNVYSDESLFLHEAIPGHHYQISLQQENTELPEFRRTLWYSAYGEGWALYSESLGEELGLYTDPYQYFGMLGAEMHRAVRLVVDAGMHSQGWTREQAIQYSLENEAESEESIISEIERYMALPGQALSYKVGQLKIRELRARAEQALGKRFRIKTFHNKVLEGGCVPLALLEAKIDAWIAQESKM